MRVVGGRFKGRPLASPKGMATRPTSDRTRESLFNILSNQIDFEACRTLDLFAGTGALGLEAISRGSAYCVFIEEGNSARGSIRTNIEALGLTGLTKVFRRDATKLGKCAPLKPFDLVFADPPYGKGFGEKAARSVREGHWLNEGAYFILEEATEAFPETLRGYELSDKREYGDTTIGIFSCVVSSPTID